MADLYRTLVIAAQDATKVRAIASAFGPGGEGMWKTPLSATGSEPVTHYISSGFIPEAFVSLSPFSSWSVNLEGQWFETDHYAGDAETVYAYASQAGLPVTLEEIQGIFLRADVSDQEPFVHLSRMGLQIIHPPMELA